MLILKLIFSIFAFILICAFFSSESAIIDNEKVIIDSAFYSTFKRVKPFKLPCTIKGVPDDSELVQLNNLHTLKPDKWKKEDSLFLSKFVCEYDNFCQFKNRAIGVEYGLYKGMKWNDSIYILTYYEWDSRDRYNSKEEKPNIILLTYNINKSNLPVDKLILYSYKKGLSELWTDIDSNFNIVSNHILSWKGLYKQYPGLALYDVELTYKVEKYHLKSNGEFELYNLIEGRTRGIQHDNCHFQFKNDKIVIKVAWELDNNGNKKKLANYGDTANIINNTIILNKN